MLPSRMQVIQKTSKVVSRFQKLVLRNSKLAAALSTGAQSAPKCNSPPKSTSKRLEGEVAIITGGASGIGEASALEFIANGARVVIADIQEEAGQTLCQRLGEHAHFVHCNVAQEKDVAAAVDFAVQRFGRLDIMYNNAGIVGPAVAPIAELDIGSLDAVYSVNMRGALLGAKHAARVMIPRRKGCILFTASVASVLAVPSTPHYYTMSKHAVVGLTRSVAMELARHNIRVNCISPHGLATNLLREEEGAGVGKEELERMLRSKSELWGVLLEARDVARAAVFLASNEDAKYISGHNLVVDGGFTVNKSHFTLLDITEEDRTLDP